jgi:hypothetical protein
MAAHAKWFSASAGKRWLKCFGSVQANDGRPSSPSSSDARWGTCAHNLSDECLRFRRDPATHLGDVRYVEGEVVVVDEEMVAVVEAYVSFVRHLVETTGGELFVEQRVDYRQWLADGLESNDGFGTADAIIVTEDELIIADLKGGAGVDVQAEGNEQLMLYALGAYAAHGLLNDFKQVRMIIVQPRKGGVKEAVISVEDLLAFGEKVKWASQTIVTSMTCGDELPRSPSDDACRWCQAKAQCPALEAEVLATVFGDFDNLEAAEPRGVPTVELPVVWAKRDMIKGFMAAIEERMFEATLAGDLPDFKIVEGRRGARKWQDEAGAEATMKSLRMKVDEMYDRKLISPTSAEKLLKDKPRTWAKVKDLIVQPNGKDSVAHVTDPRPAKVRVSEDFVDLTQE